jgi:signal transduction histidine kinase
LTAIFSNLLSNAIKAAGAEGKIRATGVLSPDGQIRLRVENTGIIVDSADSEKWFRPFASTTAKVDPGLGQGMGLGLTITRRMLGEYGSELRFISPSRGYATCIEITFPR